jgi:hypothetical protein
MAKLTNQCPECGSKSWRNIDGASMDKDDIRRVCDDCNRSYRTDKEYAMLDTGKPSALGIQIGGGHYKDMEIQPFEYTFKNKMNSGQTAVVKYISRYPFKGGKEDLLKARHTIDLMLELEYPE